MAGIQSSGLMPPTLPDPFKTHYVRENIASELEEDNRADKVGDYAKVQQLGNAISGEVDQAAIPSIYSSQIKSIVTDPSPDQEKLEAAGAYLNALNKPKSLLSSPTNIPQQSPDQLSNLAGGDGTLGSPADAGITSFGPPQLLPGPDYSAPVSAGNSPPGSTPAFSSMSQIG